MLNIFYKKYKNAKLNLPKGFTFTAHTGCMGTKQNSLESMKKGVQSGAKIIEFDLRANKNGDLVLSHDEPVGGEITLSEAFALLGSFQNTKANVDIKMTDELEKVYTLENNKTDVLRVVIETDAGTTAEVLSVELYEAK